MHMYRKMIRDDWPRYSTASRLIYVYHIWRGEKCEMSDALVCVMNRRRVESYAVPPDYMGRPGSTVVRISILVRPSCVRDPMWRNEAAQAEFGDTVDVQYAISETETSW